jgi:1-acyl-sn-glycerol-3-phosphate acyltransferase
MLLPRLARAVLVPLSRVMFRPVVEGLGHLPREGAVIIAANHLSFLDSFLIPLMTPRPVAFLAKAEYFTGTGLRGRLVRSTLTAVDAIPVPRGTHRAAQASLEAALIVLKDGRAFGIHPEGSRSRDGRLYRGRTGVAWLALTSGAPVVPVAVLGTDRVQPVGARLPRPGRVTVRFTVRFGEPLRFGPPSGSPGRARREATDRIMDAIAALSGQERADEYNHLSGTA